MITPPPSVEKFEADNQEISRTSWQISMRDGARLHGFLYQNSPATLKKPKEDRRSKTDLICLASELGNSEDHHRFAVALSALPSAPRRIFTLDMRGRGRYDPGKSGDITPYTDADDLVGLCDGLGLHHADFVASGKSAHILLLAAPKRPGMVRRLVLNDSGPEFDAVGIARMNALRKRAKQPQSFEDAAEQSKQMLGDQFPDLTREDWLEMSRHRWRDAGGKLLPNLTNDLIQQSRSFDFDTKQPELWAEFKLFQHRPVLLIRGENSPLVTQKDAERLREAHGGLVECVAMRQGHVPLLEKNDLPQKIAEFLTD